jgi:serine protease Do
MVGEDVIAIGNPFGLNNTVSRGIISALGREVMLPSGTRFRNLIQFDASINPGNSGGPLLNIDGELIGINVAIRDGAQGIAFAIPSDTVKDVLSKKLSALRMSGIDLGLACVERVEPEGTHRQRVMVADIKRQSPASQAGLQPGDQIVQVAGQPIQNRFDVERAVWNSKPGEAIQFVVYRGGQKLEVASSPDAVRPATPRR